MCETKPTHMSVARRVTGAKRKYSVLRDELGGSDTDGSGDDNTEGDDAIYKCLIAYLGKIATCQQTKGICTKSMLQPKRNENHKRRVKTQLAIIQKAEEKSTRVNVGKDFVDTFGKILFEILIKMEDFECKCDEEGCGKGVNGGSKDKCDNEFGCAVNAMVSHWAFAASFGVTSQVWIQTLNLVTLLLNDTKMRSTFKKREMRFITKINDMQFDEKAKLLLSCTTTISNAQVAADLSDYGMCDPCTYDSRYHEFIAFNYPKLCSTETDRFDQSNSVYQAYVQANACTFTNAETVKYKSWYKTQTELTSGIKCPFDSIGYSDPMYKQRCMQYMEFQESGEADLSKLDFTADECAMYDKKWIEHQMIRKEMGWESWIIVMCYRYSNVGKGTKDERLKQWKQMMKEVDDWTLDLEEVDSSHYQMHSQPYLNAILGNMKLWIKYMPLDEVATALGGGIDSPFQQLYETRCAYKAMKDRHHSERDKIMQYHSDGCASQEILAIALYTNARLAQEELDDINDTANQHIVHIVRHDLQERCNRILKSAIDFGESMHKHADELYASCVKLTRKNAMFEALLDVYLQRMPDISCREDFQWLTEEDKELLPSEYIQPWYVLNAKEVHKQLMYRGPLQTRIQCEYNGCRRHPEDATKSIISYVQKPGQQVSRTDVFVVTNGSLPLPTDPSICKSAMVSYEYWGKLFNGFRDSISYGYLQQSALDIFIGVCNTLENEEGCAFSSSQIQQIISWVNEHHRLDHTLWTRAGMNLWNRCHQPDAKRLQTWIKLLMSARQHVDMMCDANKYQPNKSQVQPSIVALALCKDCPPWSIEHVVAPMCSPPTTTDKQTQADDDETVCEVTCDHCRSLYELAYTNSELRWGNPCCTEHLHIGNIIPKPTTFVYTQRPFKKSATGDKVVRLGFQAAVSNNIIGEVNKTTILLDNEELGQQAPPGVDPRRIDTVIRKVPDDESSDISHIISIASSLCDLYKLA